MNASASMNATWTRAVAALALACAAALPAQAQTTAAPAAAGASAPAPAARGPAFALALEAAQAAQQACAARQQRVSVAVVDTAGVLRVLLAADGAHARGVQSSQGKAATALAFGRPTSRLAEDAKADAALAARLASDSTLNSRAGGVPMKAGGETLGAMGVGGARGSEVDEACALAGIERVQARLAAAP